MIDFLKNTPKDPIVGHFSKGDTPDRQLLKLSLAALGVVFGDIGTSPLYGDGMITPAISVLSAVEGIRIITPFLLINKFHGFVVSGAVFLVVTGAGTKL